MQLRLTFLGFPASFFLFLGGFPGLDLGRLPLGFRKRGEERQATADGGRLLEQIVEPRNLPERGFVPNGPFHPGLQPGDRFLTERGLPGMDQADLLRLTGVGDGGRQGVRGFLQGCPPLVVEAGEHRVVRDLSEMPEHVALLELRQKGRLARGPGEPGLAGQVNATEHGPPVTDESRRQQGGGQFRPHHRGTGGDPFHQGSRVRARHPGDQFLQPHSLADLGPVVAAPDRLAQWLLLVEDFTVEGESDPSALGVVRAAFDLRVPAGKPFLHLHITPPVPEGPGQQAFREVADAFVPEVIQVVQRNFFGGQEVTQAFPGAAILRQAIKRVIPGRELGDDDPERPPVAFEPRRRGSLRRLVQVGALTETGDPVSALHVTGEPEVGEHKVEGFPGADQDVLRFHVAVVHRMHGFDGFRHLPDHLVEHLG